MFQAEPALVYDSVQVFAHGLAALDRSHDLRPTNLSCDKEEPWDDGLSLYNYINAVRTFCESSNARASWAKRMQAHVATSFRARFGIISALLSKSSGNHRNSVRRKLNLIASILVKFSYVSRSKESNFMRITLRSTTEIFLAWSH